MKIRKGNKGDFLGLNVLGALPLQKDDTFQVSAEIAPPAYLYLVMVAPGHDVTPLYPWEKPERDGWALRPAKEELVTDLTLPRYRTRQGAKRGTVTFVLFATQFPLRTPDATVKAWFEGLPDLPMPDDGEQAVLRFKNYVEDNPDRPRNLDIVDDPFRRWHGDLKQVLGSNAGFQASISLFRAEKE